MNTQCICDSYWSVACMHCSEFFLHAYKLLRSFVIYMYMFILTKRTAIWYIHVMVIYVMIITGYKINN